MEDSSLHIDNRAAGTVKVIVAPGRSVTTGNPFKVVEVVTAGISKWVKVPAPSAEKTQFSEGEEVNLPADEARRLVALGFAFFPENRPAFSRPCGVNAHSAPPVERASPDGPTSVQDEGPGADDIGDGVIRMTQAEPRTPARAMR